MNTEIKIRNEKDYLFSNQHNWTGKWNPENKKIPGDKVEATAKVLFNSRYENEGSDKLSIIKFTIKKNCHLNPVRFKTLAPFYHVTSGSGFLKIIDDEEKVLKEYKIQADDSFFIPPKTKFSLYSINNDLEGISVLAPAWFKEDEEFEWDLVKMFKKTS